MLAPSIPNDAQRTDSLVALGVLDTPPEERFDRLTRIASRLFETPIAYLALVDLNRQWFKSNCGLSVNGTEREISMCAHTIALGDTLIIPDAANDDRFFDSPMVTGDPHIRFYAGHPLKSPEGYNVGTFCIADTKPRQMSETDRLSFLDLAAVAEQELSNLELFKLHRQLEEAAEDARQKNRENGRLLLNILPGPIAARLKGGERTISNAHEETTVLFADVVGFSTLAESLSAREVVQLLNRLFASVDEAAKTIGVEKIKTIGDAYMAVAGIPEPREDHASAALELAQRMFQVLADTNTELGTSLELRIGMASGPVVAGVIGSHKFAYDVWGHTVNLASRMESHGRPGFIQLSAATFALAGDRFPKAETHLIDVKGLGPQRAYLIPGS